MSERDRKKLASKLQVLLEGVYLLKDKEGYAISETFQRLPLRKLVDYYKIVLNPMSLHGIGRLIKGLKYTTSQEFVNDLAQISWNARLYNVKGSVIYTHALMLENYVMEKVLPKVGDAVYPDLGELPDTDDILNVPSGLSREKLALLGDDDDLDDYDEKDPNSEPPSGPGSVGASSPAPNNTLAIVNIGSPYSGGAQGSKSAKLGYGNPSGGSSASGIRRGRPPIIDKPFETRIKLILKLFKKVRLPSDPNLPITTNFDRLPDPKYNGAYYQAIKNPISLFEIRTRVRTRKYRTVDEFIADLALMFQNTKYFYQNEPQDPILHEALFFEQEANKIISLELAKPEKDLLTANTPGGDGVIRVPLDFIEENGYTYHIGDWVLIKNPNDPQRTTVGQIFRLWSTEDGTRYTNVCWYYRPEQTCHRVDRLFYVNEVCKTGQYRDHVTLEIIGPCYVLFFSRYVKNDLPDGIVPPGSPWFICEFRYNENLHVFNRIRTWKACLPDEIRDKPEHALIPLAEPRKLIKFDLPIKNLLPTGADINMPILDATPGPLPNTPPLVGSVYLRGSADDDELGQYQVSPNVQRSPENDNTAENRLAFLFTPPLQLKSGGHIGAAVSNGNHVPVSSASLGGVVPSISNASGGLGGSSAGPIGYYEPPTAVSKLNIYRQPEQHNPPHLQAQQQAQQQQQVQQHNFQQQQQQQAQQQAQQQRFGFLKDTVRKPNPTSPYSSATPVSAYGNTNDKISEHAPLAPLLYLEANDGVSAFSTVDTEGVLGISEGINAKRRRVEGGGKVNEIVWFRAPPILTVGRALDRSIGHSARYLAWKAQQ